jgi:hypothetical protein
MSRDKDTSRDNVNRQEPDDIIRYPMRPRPPRPRSSRDEVLRRLRQPSTPRERDSRHTETDPPITRPRQTRNFREEEREKSYRQAPPPQEPRTTRPMRDDTYREPRQQHPTRPSLEPRERDYADTGYARARRRREIDTEEARYGEYEEYERPVRRSGTRTRVLPPSSSPPKQRAHRRSIWSTLLIGFIGGIVMIALVVAIGWFFLVHTLQVSLPGLGIGTSKFTDTQQTIQLNITPNITQLQVINNVGNITISDDNAQHTGGTLTYVKKTQASSSSNAAGEFGRIRVKVQPGNSTACPKASCLLVNASVPTNTPGSVDMTIVLPAQNPTPQFVLNGKTQTGTISVQNFSGLLTLTDDTGNINVNGGLLAAGSCLQTRIGNVTFAGTLETATPPAINPCQGNLITASSSSQPWYSIKSGTGNIDVTLNSLSINIILDANIFNMGQLIPNQFPIAIQDPGGSPSYSGPLVPGTQPTARLLLSIATKGNITLHKV